MMISLNDTYAGYHNYLLYVLKQIYCFFNKLEDSRWCGEPWAQVTDRGTPSEKTGSHHLE